MSTNSSPKNASKENSEKNSENIPNPNEISANNDNDIQETNNEPQSNDDNNNNDKDVNGQIPSKEINIKITKIDNNKEENANEDDTKNKMNEFSKNIQNKNQNLLDRENMYINQISSLEQKIKEIQENHKNNISKLVNEGKSKDVELKTLSKENNSLKNNLENLSSKLDEMIYKSTSNPRRLIMQSKLDENKKKENYEQQIKIKEKEIRNRQQLIDILEKDNKKLKDSWNSIDNIGKDGGNKVKEQLKIKNTEIIEIQNKIKEYKHIISEHAICEKKIEFLNKIIENKRKTIHSKISETSIKDNKNNELNTKLNMVDKALEQLYASL